jgi:C4-dicarboxylate-specific signal transduction histidine kinase
MKSQKKDRLREMQLAFIGKLMAGLSHDFKNHLAIIKELNGLIEDLLLLDETRQPADIERYKKIITGINERIAQAAEMCRVLSGFSHRMDQPLSSLSVTDVLQEKIYLLRRFAQQKQVEVISSFAEDLPAIYNNPSLLQFTIFCILWPVLELMEPDGRIVITVGQKDESIEIVIQCEGTLKRLEENTPWEDMLPEVVHMLGADFSHGIDQKGNENMVLIISSLEMTHREATE